MKRFNWLFVAALLSLSAIDAHAAAVQCAVSTSDPAYTNGTTRDCSMELDGDIRVSTTPAPGTPGSGSGDVTVSGSASSAAVLTNFPISTDGFASAHVQFTSAGTSNTVVFEGSADGGSTWIFLPIQIDNAASGNFLTTSLAPSVSNSVIVTPKYPLFRARVSVYGSGTVTAYVTFKTAYTTPGVIIATGGVSSGTGPDGAAPVKIGCKYNSAGIAVTDGQRVDCQSASDGSMRVSGSAGAISDASGTITTGGTSQAAIASSAARRFWMCQNIDTAIVEDMWVGIGAAAAVNTAASIRLAPGASITFESGFIPTNAVNVIAATTGHRFTCKFSN